MDRAGDSAADAETGDKSSQSVNIAASFVGRPSEVTLVGNALRDAIDGRGRLVLVGGEAGIGKTRFAHEIGRQARSEGVEVLWGRCWEGDGAPGFWPWIQVVRGYATPRDHEALNRVMKPSAAEIVRLIPDLAQHFPTVLSTPDPIEPAEARFRQFDGLTMFLRSAAQLQPILIVLDDIHWADRSSLLFLHFLSREISDVRILILAAHRTGDPARTDELKNILPDLIRSPSCAGVLLKGLGPHDVAQFMARTAGELPSSLLVSAVWEETDGNPLFVTEIVRLLMQSATPFAAWDPKLHKLSVPETLRGVIRRRLEPLSPNAKALLEVASVFGRYFTIQSVGRVRMSAEFDLLKTLDEVTAVGLVQRVGDRMGEFRFTHALIRETIYENLSEARCAELHRVVGESLEPTLECGARDSLPALSYHFSKALPKGDAAKALRYARDAARRAVGMLAYEEGTKHYERSLRAIEFAGGAPEAFCDLLLESGLAQNKAGDIEAARHTFRRAATISRDLQSIERLTQAALGFGGVFAATGAPDSELVAFLEETIARQEGIVSAQHAMLLAGLSIALHFHGSPARRMELSRRAVAMARTVEDRRAELFAFDATHYAFWHPAGLANRIAIAREMTDLAERVENKEMAVRGHLRLVVDLLDLGDMVEVDRELGICARLADELRQPSYRWQAYLLLATRSFMTGRIEEAQDIAQKGLEIGARAEDPRAASSFWAQRFWIHRDQGVLRDFEPDAMRFLIQYADVAAWEAAYGYLLAEVGRPEDARGVLQRLTSSPRFPLREDSFFLGTLSLLAETSALLQDRTSAQTLYMSMLPFRAQNVMLGLGAVFLGSTAHYLGLLSATMGELADAESHFRHALEANVRVGARPLAARTRCEYGKVLGQLGRRDQARAQLTAAITEFEALGMVVCLERGRAALDELEGGVKTGTGVVGELGGTTADGPQLGDNTPADRAMFCPDGDYWTVSFAGKTSRLKNVRGLKYIAYLLERANVPVHALDLAVLGLQSADAGVTPAMAYQESLHAADFGGRVPILDERARAEYRSRLRELAAERGEAEQLNDYGALGRIDREIEVLSACLSAGSETGGRARRWASPAERARVNVRNSIVTALRVIGRHHDSLHRHLQNSIKTGAVCSYAPEQQVSWQVALH